VTNETEIKLIDARYKGANETTLAILQHDHQRDVEHPTAHRGRQAQGACGFDGEAQPARAKRADHVGGRRYGLHVAVLIRPVRTRGDTIIRDQIAADVAKIPARIDVKNALKKRSFVIDSIGPDAFDNFIADEVIE
jgi:hypothetical protein